MALTFGDNISYQGKKPLDARFLFSTKASMKAYSENYLPPLAFCQNEEDGNFYVYDINNEVDESTGKWRVFETGSSIEVDAEISATSENPVQNKVVKAELDKKVNSVAGKGLSANDFTNVLKKKLDGVEEGAQVNVDEVYVGDEEPTGENLPAFWLNTGNGSKNYNNNVMMTSGFNYSSAEQVVGCWVNGKPMYRQTVKVTTPTTLATDTTVYTFPTNDFETINIVDGFVLGGSNNMFPLQNANYVRTWAYMNTIKMRVETANVILNKDAYVDVVYTKITDAENSFNIDMLGESVVTLPQVREKYSTEETVCGTWIDGKPIYRRVVNTKFNATTAVGTAVSTNIATINTIDTLVNMSATAKNTTTNTRINIPHMATSSNNFGSVSIVVATDGAVSVRNSIMTNECSIYCVIEYTKTTD